MILLVASSLALLVVFAGVKLLIYIKKDALGPLYKCAAWFFIISGFVILACTGACCIAMCCKYGANMVHKQHKMMGHEENCMKGCHKGHKKMMMGSHCEGQHEGYMGDMKCRESEMNQSCRYMEVCKTDTMKCVKKK